MCAAKSWASIGLRAVAKVFAMGLNEAEVARRAGTTLERVRELIALGIIRPAPDGHESMSNGDALRAQLVEELALAGVPLDSVAAAITSGALSLSYLDRFPGPSPLSDRTYAEVCEGIGISFDLLDRMYIGFGLPRPRPDASVREDDLHVILGIPILFSSGLDESEVLRAARVWAEGPRRVAEHQIRSFHELIEEQYRERGLTDAEVLDRALTEVGVRIIPYCWELVAWLYRRHFEAYSTRHRIDHVETALDHAGLRRKATPHAEATVFADLSGYTTLTERLGDIAAADIALRLADLMQEVAERHRGRVIKMLGDGVHFMFEDGHAAVLASLDFVDGVQPRELPPAHVGVNAGPVTYTDGDYYGLSVIIAARISSTAGPGEVLVAESIARDQAPPGVAYEEIGPVPLKGVGRPVPIFRAVRVP
jgi:adenylate cyclase